MSRAPIFVNESPSLNEDKKKLTVTSVHVQTDSQNQQKPNIADYQALVERYKADNDEMRKQVKDLTQAKNALQAEVSELNNEKMAWTRVEQSLKERIHKLQADYYQSKVKTPQKHQQEEEELLSNLDG